MNCPHDNRPLYPVPAGRQCAYCGYLEYNEPTAPHRETVTNGLVSATEAIFRQCPEMALTRSESQQLEDDMAGWPRRGLAAE